MAFSFLNNNVYTGIVGSLSAGASTSAYFISRDEYPHGVNPPEAGDIYINVKGLPIYRFVGNGELQRFRVKIGVNTRGNTSFANACDVHSKIRGVLEPTGFSVSGGSLRYCLAENTPDQEDSKPMDSVDVVYKVEVQVT